MYVCNKNVSEIHRKHLRKVCTAKCKYMFCDFTKNISSKSSVSPLSISNQYQLINVCEKRKGFNLICRNQEWTS